MEGERYPGPMHVLEFGEALDLSVVQRTRVEELMAWMKAETVTIGERIIVSETALDLLFAEKRVTSASLEGAVLQIGAMQAELRAAHLRYHLLVAQILSAAQTAKYSVLRGYTSR